VKGKAALEMHLIKSSQYFVFVNSQIPGDEIELLTFFNLMVFVTNDHVIISVCRNLNPVHSSFLTYHRVCYKNTTTGATSGTRIASHYGVPQCTVK